MNKIDKKQLHDSKIFEKAIKIIMSKSKKPKEEFFSSSMQRYDEVAEKYDVIGCAHALNELKIYFDGSLKGDQIKRSPQLLFIKSLKIFGELYSYHNGDKKDKNWKNTVKLLNGMNIPENHEQFQELKNFFSEKN